VESQGRFADAEVLYLRLLGDRARSLGEGHEDTLTCMNNLAWLQLLELGKPEAGRLFERLGMYWKNPVDWKTSWAKLGAALAAGDEAGARRALKALTRLLGPGHERVARAKRHVARVASRA
jgi:hypothetical protein